MGRAGAIARSHQPQREIRYRDGQVAETICTDSTRRCGDAVRDPDTPGEGEVVVESVAVLPGFVVAPPVVVPAVVLLPDVPLELESSCPVIRT